MNRIRWYGPTLVLLLTVVAVMALGPQAIERIVFAQGSAENDRARQQLRDSDFLAQLSDAFRDVSNSVKRSVVSIEVLAHRDPDERDILRRMLPGFPEPRQREREREREPGERYEQYDPPQQRGAGSGWVYDEQGHIITNYHVVANADTIRVRFSDGGSTEAQVVGYDERTDIAVLKVNSRSLHPAALSDESVEQGDIVFAFGSPFGFEFSVSQGIVSAKGRQLEILRDGYENFIQTDAAINRGNSGGPLTNIYGQVVGMNTAIASRTGMYSGLGFAIPVAMVRHIADQLIEDGEVQRGYLGIYIRDLPPEAIETFEGFDADGGVLVDDPIPGSPAEAAGVRGEDIIIAVDGEPVRSADELRFLIADLRPGTVVELTIFRDGQTINQEVTLALRDEAPQLGQRRPRPRPGAEEPAESREGMQMLLRLGIERARTLDEETARQLDIQPIPGVVIERVRTGSLAHTRRLNTGMIITRVMNEPVENTQQLVEQLERYEPGRTVRLRIAEWDRNEERYRHRSVFLELPGGN